LACAVGQYGASSYIYVGSNGVSPGLGGIRSYELECFSFVGESAMGRWDGWSGGEMGCGWDGTEERGSVIYVAKMILREFGS
jgi:hypothetical protein